MPLPREHRRDGVTAANTSANWPRGEFLKCPARIAVAKAGHWWKPTAREKSQRLVPGENDARPSASSPHHTPGKIKDFSEAIAAYDAKNKAPGAEPTTPEPASEPSPPKPPPATPSAATFNPNSEMESAGTSVRACRSARFVPCILITEFGLK